MVEVSLESVEWSMALVINEQTWSELCGVQAQQWCKKTALCANTSHVVKACRSVWSVVTVVGVFDFHAYSLCGEVTLPNQAERRNSLTNKAGQSMSVRLPR